MCIYKMANLEGLVELGHINFHNIFVLGKNVLHLQVNISRKTQVDGYRAPCVAAFFVVML